MVDINIKAFYTHSSRLLTSLLSCVILSHHTSHITYHVGMRGSSKVEQLSSTLSF